MATIKREGLPEFWPSSLTGLLVGAESCHFAPWIKSHFRIEKIPSTFDFAAWNVQHTALVNETLERLTAQGWKCRVEGQNHFRVTGTTCVLAGKPDIVARKETRVKVVDCKTGAPQDKHGVQVATYMIALPMAWQTPKLADFIEGEVVYASHSVKVPVESVGPIRPQLFGLLKRLASDVRPEAVPSESGCRYCEVTATDCPQRWTAKYEPAATTVDF